MIFNIIIIEWSIKILIAVSTVPVPAPQLIFLSIIVPVSPYKILYSYVALVPAPSCIWQYKFVHKFAGTLDSAYNYLQTYQLLEKRHYLQRAWTPQAVE